MTPITRDLTIKRAFDSLKGQVQVGDVVAIYDDSIAYELAAVDGSMGICQAPGHPTRRYPVSELANVNLVKAEAVRLHQEEIANALHSFN